MATSEAARNAAITARATVRVRVSRAYPCEYLRFCFMVHLAELTGIYVRVCVCHCQLLCTFPPLYIPACALHAGHWLHDSVQGFARLCSACFPFSRCVLVCMCVSFCVWFLSHVVFVLYLLRTSVSLCVCASLASCCFFFMCAALRRCRLVSAWFSAICVFWCSCARLKSARACCRRRWSAPSRYHSARGSTP